MKTKEAIEYFGSVKRLAAAVDVTYQAVSAWGEYPPKGKQYELQVKTGGKLKAEPDNHRAPGSHSSARRVD